MPFEGGYYIVKDKKGNETLGIDVPTSNDWWHMYVTVDGKVQSPTKPYDNATSPYYIRGFHELNDLVVPNEGAEISIVLEDYAGNKSTPTVIIFEKK